MKNKNIKLIMGALFIMGTTSCSNDVAYDNNGDRLSTNLSETIGYGTGTAVDYSNYGYGVNEYSRNPYRLDANDYDNNNLIDRTNYNNNNLIDRTNYVNDLDTDFTNNLENDFTDNMVGVVDYRGEKTSEILDNDVNDLGNAVTNTAKRAVRDVQELADTTMEEVGDVTDNIMDNDTTTYVR